MAGVDEQIDAALQVAYRAKGSAADRPAGDEVLAMAVLDRRLHKAHVLDTMGRGDRLRDLEQSPGGIRP